MPKGRAIWSGAVSFGLVNLPVKVFGATRSHDIRFNQLERGTGARIRYRKVSEASGDEVAAENIVKGYEITPGAYVMVDADELAALDPKASRLIEIERFVDLAEVDPLFFDTSYYLVPDEVGRKPYKLLVETMARERRAGIGRVVMRSKEHLAAIRAVDGVLCLTLLRFADEVVAPAEIAAELDLDAIEVSEREQAMACQLVDTLAADWEPSQYADSYREQVMALIEAKAAGAEPVVAAAAEPSAKVVDLMAALEASIASAKADRAAAAAAGAASEAGGRGVDAAPDDEAAAF